MPFGDWLDEFTMAQANDAWRRIMQDVQGEIDEQLEALNAQGADEVMKQFITTASQPPGWLQFERAQRQGFRTEPGTQKLRIYKAVLDRMPDGATRVQLSVDVNLPPDRVGFYLSELKREGYLRTKDDPTTVSANMTADEACMAALAGLENALVAVAKQNGITDDMNKSFLIYQKVKERVLRPGTDAEGRVALKMALKKLIDAVF